MKLIAQRFRRDKPQRFIQPDLLHSQLEGCFLYWPFLDKAGQVSVDAIRGLQFYQSGTSYPRWLHDGMYFTGSSVSAAIATFPGPELVGPLTLVLEVVVTSTDASYKFLTSCMDSSSPNTNTAFYLRFDGSQQLILQRANATTYTNWTTSGLPTPERFKRHLMVVSQDGLLTGNARFWVNGVEYSSSASGSATGSPTQSLNQIKIGAAVGGTYTFTGAILQFRLYNRALNDGEVAAIMDAPWAPFKRRILLPISESASTVTASGTPTAAPATITGVLRDTTAYIAGDAVVGNASINGIVEDLTLHVSGELLSSGAEISGSLSQHSYVSTSDTISLTDSWGYNIGFVLIDVLALLDAWQSKTVQTQLNLQDQFDLADSLAIRLRLALSDSFTITDTLALGKVIAALHDTLQLDDSFTAVVTQTLLLQDALGLVDAFGLRNRLTLSDALVVTDTLVALARQIVALTDTVGLADNFVAQFSVLAFLSDTLALSDSFSWKIQAVLQLADTFSLVGRFQVGDDEYLAWAVNTKTQGAYKFSNFLFNSFARVGGKNLMCASDGIYEFGGDDDNGAAIEPMLRTGRLNFANKEAGLRGDTLKQALSAYLLFDSQGEVLLKVTTSRRNAAREDWYYLKESTQMAKRQLPLSKSLRSVLWQFELKPLDGKPASFKEIQIIPLHLSRRE